MFPSPSVKATISNGEDAVSPGYTQYPGFRSAVFDTRSENACGVPSTVTVPVMLVKVIVWPSMIGIDVIADCD